VSDLIAFWNARLDEAEAAADRAGGGGWEYRDSWVWCGPFEMADIFGYDVDAEEVGGHIALHDPARVLREVAADRQLLALYQGSEEVSPASAWESDGTQALADAVRIRVAVHSDHPDYDQKWKP
jgi:hypothetical protein